MISNERSKNESTSSIVLNRIDEKDEQRNRQYTVIDVDIDDDDVDD